MCITLYWLGRCVAELPDYAGPQLDLNLFKKLMEGDVCINVLEGYYVCTVYKIHVCVLILIHALN